LDREGRKRLVDLQLGPPIEGSIERIVGVLGAIAGEPAYAARHGDAAASASAYPVATSS
jgi:hypothetical protein